MTDLDKIEYKVRKVERYIVTRYEEGADEANKQFARSVGRGEYGDAETAYEVAYALAKAEHQALGWPLDDERIQYPCSPGIVFSNAGPPQSD